VLLPQIVGRLKITRVTSGATENARTENEIPSKMQGWQTRNWKMWHQCVRVENSGPNAMERQKTQ